MLRKIPPFIVCFLLMACGHSKDQEQIVGDTLTHTSQLLTLIQCDGYTVAQVADPWNKGKYLGTYILVPHDQELPANLPQGTLLRTPLERTIVYSSVHGNAINQIGKLGAIVGVTEPEYFVNPRIVDRLKSGKLQALGSSMQPAVEKIVSLNPDAILLSPYENAGVGVVGELNIPIIQMADYMEVEPLGRAEWIKFLGQLYGAPVKADKMFEAASKRYNELKELASTASSRPKVVTEQVNNGVWFVPGGKAYQAQMIKDAGADYPWINDTTRGSIQLDFSAVFSEAHDADIWLVKSQRDVSMRDIEANYPLNAQMDAFKKGNIWNANTLGTTVFDDFPFRPDTMLRDYIIVFHPELNLGEPTYFKHVVD